ncbi:MAG: PaaI family thioesterase [Flavobacteriales bacterium]|nr:PaaI family thioesterase [Flavobacteriales bacterium]
MYLSANINTQVFDSTTCSIEEGKAIIGLTVEPKYFHALGAIHGSVYFKLLDDAAFFAASSLVDDVFILTASFSLDFLRPVNQGVIRAEGKVLSTGNRSIEAESTLYNQDGKVVAKGKGVFVKGKNALSKDIGYV